MKRIWAVCVILVVSFFLGIAPSDAALYFPHVDTNGWQTEICVINLAATDTIQGNLESYSNSGDRVATLPISVGPNSRRQIDVGAELPNAGSTGYIVFQNTSGAPVGYTKFTQVGGERVAIPAVDSVNSDTVYITHIAWVPWWTGVSLVNTTAATKTITIRFNTGESRALILRPKEHMAFTISGLLDGLLDTRIESAVIENASGIVGLELFGNLAGFGKQLGGVPLTSKTATTLFYPHVDSTPGQWWTGIVAYNPSATATAQITVNSYNADGTQLGSAQRSIGPGQKYIGASTDLNLPAGTAWFSLQSQIPLVGFELFGTADFNTLAGYSVVDLEGKAGVFPKVEKDGWTGIAFVNTENQPATVTLKAYTGTGTVLGTGSNVLNAYAKVVGLAETLLPGVNLSNATYLSFSANRNVAGFQLNSSGGTKLDALPAASPSSQKVIDKALDFFRYQSAVTLGMSTVTDIMNQILESTSGGTCPQVTVTPPLDDLSALPPSITITADYGGGCTATDGSTMSGRTVLALTNLAMTDTSVVLDLALTATNLRRNGTLALNGSVSGHIALAIADNIVTQATASLQFSNFQAADSLITGGLTLTGTNIDLSGGTLGSATVTLNNLAAAGYTAYSGTLTISSAGADTTQIVAALVTSQGNVNMTLMIQTTQLDDSTRMVLNTPVPGTIGGYAVAFTNVVVDTGVCSGYPTGGSVTASQGGSGVTVAFTPSCPAGQLREPVAVAPARDLNPWFSFGTGMYRYLNAKR